jgi:hypothetical protein
MPDIHPEGRDEQALRLTQRTVSASRDHDPFCTHGGMQLGCKPRGIPIGGIIDIGLDWISSPG